MFITTVKFVDGWKLLCQRWRMLAHFTTSTRLFSWLSVTFLWCLWSWRVSHSVLVYFILRLDGHFLVFAFTWSYRVLRLWDPFIGFFNNLEIMLFNLFLQAGYFFTLLKLLSKVLSNCRIARFLFDIIQAGLKFSITPVENFMLLDGITEDIVNLFVHLTQILL